MRYVLRPGLAPLPGIGPGPLEEAEYLECEARYMSRFATGAPTPRDRGIYAPEAEAPKARGKTRAQAPKARAKKGAAPVGAPEVDKDKTRPADDAPGEEQER